jgi:hypothetical protein
MDRVAEWKCVSSIVKHCWEKPEMSRKKWRPIDRIHDANVKLLANRLYHSGGYSWRHRSGNPSRRRTYRWQIQDLSISIRCNGNRFIFAGSKQSVRYFVTSKPARTSSKATRRIAVCNRRYGFCSVVTLLELAAIPRPMD